MNAMKQSDLEELIRRSLQDFHVKRINGLRTLKLRTVLRKKNPYLFRAVRVQKASEIVTEILRTHLTSSDRAFWEELTGDPAFYLKLIDLMRDYPMQHRIEFEKEWDKAINRFEYDFLINFGLDNDQEEA